MNEGPVYDALTAVLERETGVLTLTLDRPEVRNALNGVLVDELCDALARADADPEIRAVLIRGEGPDFCAGADLSELERMADAGVEEQLADADALADLFLIMRRIAVPIVAGVHGHAVAGGCGLASACDIVIASEDARFGYPEVKIGFVPAMVIAMLRRAVGEKRAFELVTTGRTFGAASAADYGLVQMVYGSETFDERCREFVTELAGRSASAIGLAKRLLYESEGHSFEAAVRAGAEVNVLARGTSDYREGLRRFLESRKRDEGGGGGGST